MPICKRTKIRSDVRKLMDDFLKMQMTGIMECLSGEENQEFDFKPYI